MNRQNSSRRRILNSVLYNNIGDTLLTSRMDDETMTRFCKICGSELNDEADDICDSCKSIIANQNMGVNGFKV